MNQTHISYPPEFYLQTSSGITGIAIWAFAMRQGCPFDVMYQWFKNTHIPLEIASFYFVNKGLEITKATAQDILDFRMMEVESICPEHESPVLVPAEGVTKETVKETVFECPDQSYTQMTCPQNCYDFSKNVTS